MILLVESDSFSIARSDGPRIQTTGIEISDFAFSSGAGVHTTDQLAEILPRVSRTPLGEDCESGSR